MTEEVKNQEVEEVKNQEVGETEVENNMAGTRTNQSRSEKKARKAMAKMGLVPVNGINRVVLRRSKNVCYKWKIMFFYTKTLLNDKY